MEENAVLAKPIVLQDKMILKKGSFLKKGTQIAEGSILYEGLAPGRAVLPPCNTVFLDASGSADPDGNPLSLTWDMGDGTTAEGIRVIHTYRKSGSYVVSIIAKDNSGAINDAASKAITITINTPPIAQAGDQKWACSGDTVRFDGTKSYDPDGFVTNQKWFFGDGTSSDGDTAVHVYDEPGVYSVRLDVTDNSQSVCSADSDGVVVIINEPPVAKTGMDIAGCDYTVRFNGTKSFDPDGKITKYLWYFGDGSVGEGATPEHIYSGAGVYNIKLIVFDDSESRCNTSSDEMKVLINVTPVAEAGPDRRVCQGYKVFFNGAASYDPNGDILSYSWDFGDGTPESTEMSPVHTYKKAGKYTVRLTLMDSSDTACAISTDIASLSADTNPVADAGPDQLVDVGQNVTLDASGSMDPNGYPLTYNWTFGDLSNPAEGVSVSHVYGKPGIYRALVTVTSTANHGCNTNYDELKVTVNNPPVARAGTSVVTHAGAEVIFNGESSFDPDGSITSYKWDFGDETASATSSKPKEVHSYSEPGRYTATLAVKDNSGLPGGVGSDTVDVIVNFPPTADAGKSRTVCIGQVFFDGTGSKDPDGNIISYEWDFGDGGKGSGGRPVHIYRSPGIYEATLTVTDNSGTATNKASAVTRIEINGPPLVDIGGQKQLSCPEEPTLLDASASADPNGDKINYGWDFGDGEKATGVAVEHIYKTTGRFIASVTASDGRNMKCSQNTASKIVIINDLPIADAGPNQLVNPHDSVSFKGTGSVDPDGKITEYAWKMGDGAVNEGMKVKHTYTAPGKYTVRLTVKDDSATVCDKNTDEMTVTVNAPPIADAGPDKVNLCSGTVQFDGSASKDPDGIITFYEWDFGDGSPSGMGPKPKHTYAKPGTYNIILRVIDDSNLRTSISNDAMKVIINYPPVAKIKAPKIVCPDEAVKMSAKDSYDSDGSIIQYEWNFGDGTPNIQGRNITHTYSKPGKYDVVLTVIDNSDSSCDIGTATHTVTVNSPPVAKAGGDVITCVRTTDCSVIYDASNSKDEDGDHLTYHWDFGNGNTKEGIRVRYEYENPGVYTVTLTVADDSGTVCGRDTATMKITANAPPDIELKKGD
ncbi:MAG: PKD domain-containing protein [Desulfobacterales bacterium]|nr:PKD domain-containing protein [Desulfobacterales bacterium]